ncbi:hypothetical protein [Pseudobutyrivibrio sp. MD2005]|uniref:hypothetical protein n=1 Tax=Pseudobutyrivibrio sp. MD2005 TaxID=1410616 RepID=UPI000488C968|nr:hypothetical protein [Pseudobutyrivibrio sp. MD2005]
MELKLNDLENVVGGISIDEGDVTAYCQKCGAKLKYKSQKREEGGNTGVFVCENTNYKNTGRPCPNFGLVKSNNEVNFMA